jgi:hypothetical protein
LFHVDRPPLVGEGRTAGDDVEPFDPRQAGDDVLDDADRGPRRRSEHGGAADLGHAGRVAAGSRQTHRHVAAGPCPRPDHEVRHRPMARSLKDAGVPSFLRE